jgi:integrase
MAEGSQLWLRSARSCYRPWPEVDIEKFRVRRQLRSRERLAPELLLNTGQRRSDIVRMGGQHVRERTISVRQRKTGNCLDIPLHQDLAATIAARRAARWHSLSVDMARRTRQAALVTGSKRHANRWAWSAHGLRKAICRRLAEAGCSASEIMSVGGWRNIREVESDVAAARQKKLAGRLWRGSICLSSPLG